MKRALKITLLAAAPIEIANLWLVTHYSIDMGLDPETSRWLQYAFVQAMFLHYPAFFLLDWVNQHHLPMAIFYLGLLVSGYLDTALLLAVVFGIRSIHIPPT